MKTYKTISIIILLLLIQKICISCEKMLEVDIPANQIASGQVFEDVQTANSALASLYAGLWDNSPLAGDQTGKLLGTYTDDLSYFGSTSTNGVLEIYQNAQIDSNPAIYSYWSNAYQKIYLANSIIEGAANSSLPQNEKNRIKGEALLVRSVIFFYLQQIFGDIPYPTTTEYWINQTLVKTPATQTLNLLATDLNESVTLLSDEYRSIERIFPNRKVAQLMLARVYILQMQWANAETSLKAVLQSPLYQFQNDVNKVFLNSSRHIIWQLKPKNSGDATKEVVVYYFTASAPTSFSLSQDLVNIFSPSDLRKQNWMATVSFNGNTWSRSDKYKNRSNNTTEYSIIFRLEEAYLLLAETLAQQNKITEALPYLNATRQRANLISFTEPISKETLLSEILLESRKEFFAEMGHRFFDLKRANRLNTLLTVKPNWKDFHKLWPLPQKELLLNSNLKPQNNGY
jgi:hypothetical protein